MAHRNKHIPAAAFIAGALLLCCPPSGPAGGLAHAAGSAAQRRVYTPAAGSPERKAILDALREETRQLHQAEVVFVVNHLKVQNNWAWVQAAPQSEDGSNRYENVSALLRKRRGVWAVVEVPCAEEGNPDCIGESGYFKRLMTRFPLAPRGIFPEQ